ncbi:MraY family glycosyltransferase [Methanococcus voltae]|uniref:MraY family glycosyltransferase n=1 Tax=Methanococcus voltae TaxID=2188 RepID=UPI001AE9530E|nr:glycosyltransferase 4 family protein [Methanococcus voltae]MBP2172108.1 UDP-N-acetylglucosamine--dolichyl-phosphate N-acetylglucosaminephosphotransferase [Methanococcus voltae]
MVYNSMILGINTVFSRGYSLIIILGFFTSIILTKFMINKMVDCKFGNDLHKKEKLKVAEMGGLALLLTLSIFLPFIEANLLVPVLIAGILGVIDDIAKLSPKEKLLILALSAIPTGLLLGFSPIYIVLLMFGISICSNFTNMLAGFNGLEIGTGTLASLFLALIMLQNGDSIGFNSLILFFVTYLGFLTYNKYPAKVFPGDTGTLPIGAFLATLAVWKSAVLPLIIIMIPYIIDAGLKYYSAGVTKREEHKPTQLGEDGKLYVAGGYLSLPRLILMKKPMREYNIVFVIWALEILCGITALFVNSTVKII